MQNHTQLNETLSSLSNWKPLAQIANEHPQFTYSQLKHLFWKRKHLTGLSQCARLIGRKLYVNEPAFARWLAGDAEFGASND